MKTISVDFDTRNFEFKRDDSGFRRPCSHCHRKDKGLLQILLNQNDIGTLCSGFFGLGQFEVRQRHGHFVTRKNETCFF